MSCCSSGREELACAAAGVERHGLGHLAASLLHRRSVFGCPSHIEPAIACRPCPDIVVLSGARYAFCSSPSHPRRLSADAERNAPAADAAIVAHAADGRSRRPSRHGPVALESAAAAGSQRGSHGGDTDGGRQWVRAHERPGHARRARGSRARAGARRHVACDVAPAAREPGVPGCVPGGVSDGAPAAADAAHDERDEPHGTGVLLPGSHCRICLQRACVCIDSSVLLAEHCCP